MQENFVKKKLLPLKTKFYFVSVKNLNALVIETPFLTKKYIKLPLFLNLKKIGNYLHLKNLNNVKFDLLISSWLKGFVKPFKKQLILKGLGFKGSVNNEGSLLELKLGFSHIVNVPLDTKKLKVSMNNNILTAEGFEPDNIGNFLEKIRKLKKIDSYKGKGFWYKNESRVLKEIKKT